VPQDRDDESASALLDKLTCERVQGPSQGRLKNRIQLPTVDPGNVPFPVPEGWKWARFGDVATIASKLVEPASFRDMPHIAPDNIEKGTGRLLEYRTVGEDRVRSGNHRFFPGQILYSKIRPNLSKAVLVDFDGLCSADMYPIKSHIYAPFLLAYILSSAFLRQAVRNDTRVAMPKINQAELNTVLVPVPPAAEQRRIVAKAEQLMALCDELEAQQEARREVRARLHAAAIGKFVTAASAEEFGRHWQRLREHFALLFAPGEGALEAVAALRQAILQLAAQGRLAPQDPNEEPIHATLCRALERRAELVRSKKVRHKKLDECAEFAKPADLPGNWTVERLGNLVDPVNPISYGVLVPGHDVPDGIPFVRAQDLALSSHPDRPNKTISLDIEKSYARTRLRGGEILLCVVGSIGKLGIVPPSWAGANIARAVARILPVPEISRDYLLVVLRGQSVQTYFTETTRTLAQPTLNVGLIEQTPIPLPPLAE